MHACNRPKHCCLHRGRSYCRLCCSHPALAQCRTWTLAQCVSWLGQCAHSSTLQFTTSGDPCVPVSDSTHTKQCVHARSETTSWSLVLLFLRVHPHVSAVHQLLSCQLRTLNIAGQQSITPVQATLVQQHTPAGHRRQRRTAPDLPDRNRPTRRAMVHATGTCSNCQELCAA